MQQLLEEKEGRGERSFKDLFKNKVKILWLLCGHEGSENYNHTFCSKHTYQ